MDSNGDVVFSPANDSRVRVLYMGGSTMAHLISVNNGGITPVVGYVYSIAGGGRQHKRRARRRLRDRQRSWTRASSRLRSPAMATSMWATAPRCCISTARRDTSGNCSVRDRPAAAHWTPSAMDALRVQRPLAEGTVWASRSMALEICMWRTRQTAAYARWRRPASFRRR